MVSAQDAALIVLGLLATFTGYSMFRSMMPLWGFVLGGWISYIMAPTILGPALAGNLIYVLGVTVVGGLIGAAIAIPLYFVIIFLSGGALGMLIGIMVGAVIDVGGISTAQAVRTLAQMTFPPTPHSTTQFVLMIIFGLILGATGIAFQKFMICASSAFIGSAALITGLGGPITQISSTDMSRAAIMLMAWMILGMVGLLVQFRMMGEV